ncbi:MAG: DUF547 domain-containing protein [Candidatus Melainabacteria bacterium]|nr:DUF547 domain-containing protein [Candidatus Melainabacteria bacterium]
MKAIATNLLALLTVVSAQCIPAYAAVDLQHTLFSEDLKLYVDNDLVHYKKWKGHTERLEQYLKSLAQITQDEYEKLSTEDKKALWVNAYNAFTVKVVLDHYPISGSEPFYPKNSFRQIPDAWDDYFFVVAGRRVSLNDIEHNIGRRLHDPRIHFAVVCAAKGCAKINKEAYIGKTIETALDAQTDKFILNPENVSFDHKEKTVRVSKLFSWFPLDFLNAVGFKTMPFPPPKDEEVVLRYIVSRSSKEVQEKFKSDDDYRAYKVIYRDYDWSLNDAD